MMYGCTPYGYDEESVVMRSGEEINAYYEAKEEEYIPISERKNYEKPDKQ